MTVACVVQARMGSTRLPGKIMLDLAGRPVICHVIERAKRIPGVDVVVCATPKEKASELIHAFARGAGAEIFSGSETDVLDRTLGAARSVAADHVVRVTSDCPLIDPEICGEVLRGVVFDRADYASNVDPRTYPQGLDCEAFTISALVMADRSTSAKYDREHATPWLRRPGSNLTRKNKRSGDVSLAGKRWTLDWPEDLEFFRAVYSHGKPQSMGDVLAILAAHPEIEQINAERNVA